jgi:hypothetical protein
MTLDEAIKIAMNGANDPIAVAYLQAIPRAIEEYGTDGLKTQLLYALSNMAYWRGPLAKECKEVMKKFASSEHLQVRGVR